MENIKENQNVKELTDEQLKEVSGGICTYDDDDEDRCPTIDGCDKYDALCNCTKCYPGMALDSGVCKPPRSSRD